jgi:hypothetical protein
VFFNLILARRGMHVRMGMRFAGRGGMRKTVRAGNGNENDRTCTTSLRTENVGMGMGMTEHARQV